MKALGELLRAHYPDIEPVYDPDYLRQLPPTDRLRASLAPVLDRLADYEAEGMDGPIRLRAERDRFLRAIAAGEERDRLQAERPAGCWCLGRGGKGERAVLLDLGDDDPPTVLSVYCDCPEGAARREYDDATREDGRAAWQRMAIAALWRGMGIPERFADCTLDTYPVSPKTAAALETVRGWLAGPAWALVLTGPFGTGKSGLGIGVLRQAAEQRLAGLFVKAPDLLLRVRSTYGHQGGASETDVLDSLRAVPLLVVDDVGADKATDWATALLWQVLDSRHDHLRKTLVTTNLPATELAKHLGARTMERFTEGGLIVPVAGPNLRRSAA